MNKIKIPVVKEWGSWAVFFSSCLAGLITGLRSEPWVEGREFATVTVLTITGLTLLVNSKNPLASAIRTGGQRKHVLWFLFFFLAGLSMLIPFLIEGFSTFVVFSLFILSYAVLLSVGKEHHIIAELNGFSLLTVSAPAVYFAVTGEMSWNLYVAVTLYFAAGVFKVRLRIRKSLFFRRVMVIYCLLVYGVFHYLGISAILLIPLVENIVTAALLREEKLSTTGNTELIKSIIFIILTGFFWR